MTLEEKLTYMQTVSMEQARAEGNAIIDAHREALEKIFSDHKSEMMRQAETRIKAETTNAKRTVSQALAKSQLEIKRSQGKVQQELKDKVFEEAMQLICVQNSHVKTNQNFFYLTRTMRVAFTQIIQRIITLYDFFSIGNNCRPAQPVLQFCRIFKRNDFHRFYILASDQISSVKEKIPLPYHP